MEADMMRRFSAALALAMLSARLGGLPQKDSSKRLEEFERNFPAVTKNAAAEELERLALALGIDWNSGGGEHPMKEDLDAYRQAGFGSWLDAQLKTSDDSIAPPPPRLKELLERRQSVLTRMVSLLEREVPEWGFNAREKSMEHSSLLLTNYANRVLLCAALVAQRSGRHAESAEYLEASWSLSQSLVERPDILSLIIAVSVWKQQAGALRKISEPPFQWLERLSNDSPRRQLVTALENDLLVSVVSSPDSLPGEMVERLSGGYRVLTSLVLESSACRLSKLSREEMRQRVLENFKSESEPEPKPGEEEESPEESVGREQRPGDFERAARIMMEIAAPTAVDLVRRVERLLVDRELTWKILELRQERAAARTGRWPENFPDLVSTTCPESSFEYQPRGNAMTIRFRAYVEEPDAPGLILPLSFEIRRPEPTPAPTPARRPRPRATPAKQP
jgi:hypothetical protein